MSCRAWFNLLTLAADGCIPSYYGYLISYKWLYCLFDVIDGQIETYEGYEYTPYMDLDSLSPMRVYFQFRALTDVIRLILLF